ncbi:MAG: hypothetical protein KatS3mg043_0933 [Rhodothermaceae bacterium]|nr:MAG: hypothetical protein KatS3mg043_0933 [Rhodothermaceae bacterium]
MDIAPCHCAGRIARYVFRTCNGFALRASGSPGPAFHSRRSAGPARLRRGRGFRPGGRPPSGRPRCWRGRPSRSARVRRASTSSTVRAISCRARPHDLAPAVGQAGGAAGVSQPARSLRTICTPGCVRPVLGQRPEGGGVDVPAVQVKGFRHTRAFVQVSQHGRLVDGVLGHLAVGGPLAAGDGDEPRAGDVERVVPRDLGRFRPVVAGVHERAEAGEDAQHVGGGWGLS